MTPASYKLAIASLLPGDTPDYWNCITARARSRPFPGASGGLLCGHSREHEDTLLASGPAK